MKKLLLYLILLPFLLKGQDMQEKDFYSPGDDQWATQVHPSYALSWLHKQNFNPKIGGIDFSSDGRMFICTWDSIGAVYELSNVASGDTNQIKIRRVASGLCEPLGLKVINNKIYVFQRPELTRLSDVNGDGIMDKYQCISSQFGFNGNYHEFSFGLLYKDGWFYGSLSTQRRVKYASKPDRGSVLRIDTTGNVEYLAHGFRTPNGLVFGPDSALYMTDNEGEWLPSSKIVRVKKGAFYGFRNVDLAGTLDLPVQLPVVWMPHNEISNSPSQPLVMQDGVYKNQLIVGDVTHGGIKRIYVQKVDTVIQGCVFGFTQGLEGGINRMCWGPDGGLYVGAVGSVGNWGQGLPKHRYGLQKLMYNGKTTFEVLKINATSDGFELEFTKPIMKSVGWKRDDVQLKQWRYEPTERYGGPKLEEESLEIIGFSMTEDGKKMSLKIKGLKKGRVVYFKLSERIKSNDGERLWTTKAWYTLNVIPGKSGESAVNYRVPSKTNVASKPSKNTSLTDSQITLLGPGLVAKSGCLQCHHENEKIIGPSFRMIAGKYKKDGPTIDKLTEKVYKGGKGVWGEEEMSAQSHLTKADIQVLVRYILSRK